MVGATALVSIALPQEAYDVWKSPKFLDAEMSTVLIIAIILMFLGIQITSYRSSRGGAVTISFAPKQIRFLQVAYRWLMLLTLVGYGFWIASAASQGVSSADLSAVIDRELGAISELKESSRPIAGVTTLTQFGPVAVVIGYVLYRLGAAKRRYLVILALAAVRTLFYAERLALLEVLIPLVVAASLLVRRNSKRRALVQAAPLLLAPVVWTVFAVSEYVRSWIYYQQVVSLPFAEWVTLRLFGYYTTSYNNSALYATEFAQTNALPYSSIPVVWNAPLVDKVFSHPGISGLAPDEWWAEVLKWKTNPEFTNVGSFLTTYGEFGWFYMSIFWLATGLIVGAVFSSLQRGSAPALLTYCALFVALLELPRFIYWTQGRAFPIVLALVLIAIAYPRSKRNPEHALTKSGPAVVRRR